MLFTRYSFDKIHPLLFFNLTSIVLKVNALSNCYLIIVIMNFFIFSLILIVILLSDVFDVTSWKTFDPNNSYRQVDSAS